MANSSVKNKYVAAVFALFFGWTGAHHFYLGNKGKGILYAGAFLLGWLVPIFFILRWIPILLGLIDAASLFMMSEKVFDKKYNKDVGATEEREYSRAERKYRRHRKPDFERSSDTGGKRDYRQRKTTSQAAVKSNPFKLSGIRKFKEFDIRGALEDFRKGLEFSPEDISLHFNVACSYSMLENAEKGYEHLSKAVSLGFNDFEKIKTHDSLAFLRIQPQWDEFVENGYSLEMAKEAPQEKEEEKKEYLPESDQLLTQLNKLAELREKGLITEEEFAIEKRKLTD